MNNSGFEALALEVFKYQAQNNTVYKAYLQVLGKDQEMVTSLSAIPFLPISFYKSHQVKTGEFAVQEIFESSGTTRSISSRHFVKDLSLYEGSFIKGFALFYGPVKNYCILGLLPSYLERKKSSLVYMVDKLIQLSEHPQSGFYLNEYEQLAAVLQELEKRKQPTLLIGATFALLDFAEKFSFPLRHTIMMETGGMKGRREEMIRAEVHDVLEKAFHMSVIHSEYGMTELLSQAWSKADGIFNCPPWMKVLMRDDEDPFMIKNIGSGTINVVDLVNIHSCSFIATDDVGKLYPDGRFEVLGRMDGSDLRGCSLMVL
ncbi:MAG TPA: hypothetical protein VN451_03525 [Chitinophagaceae bacterium]|nr:hypothetical protein [Chitinophagaceae bacterium]